MNVIRGINSNPTLSESLINKLYALNIEGTLYIGFPIISLDDETNHCDAMLLSEKHGIIIFDFNNKNFSDSCDIERAHDKLYLALKSKLIQHIELTTKSGRERTLDIPIDIVLYGYNIPDNFSLNKNITILNDTIIDNYISEFPDTLKQEYIVPLKAAIDSVKTIKPRKKRASVEKQNSKGAVLKKIEKEIANFDRWQQEAAIETPEGPQRIRGLAGSGKTVVLARKAAYLHAQHPDWNIIITYNTRSLHQQIKELVRRFYYDQSLDEPNWDNIKIIPAWGGKNEGIYSQVAKYYNIEPLTFLDAKAKYGYIKALKGVCDELLIELEQKDKKPPLYDALLIDEAQDLPKSFFQIAYEITKEPKRIIWAYDELQNLGGYSMYSPEELFGAVNEEPRVSLRNRPDQPKQDVILPKCYRNTRWALTIAHALGFGIYRKKGLVQIFNDADLWNDIGYEILEGNFNTPGETVKLARKEACSPSFFNHYLTSEASVKCKIFENKSSQYDWLIEDIKSNLQNEEIEEDDILIILPDPLTGKKEAALIVSKLITNDLNAHIVGVTNDKETVFIEKSIAISGIHRAKGNEAPLVYIVNSQYCFEGLELSRKRNIIFTAITRSRAWVNILGYNDLGADNMQQLFEEYQKTINKNYSLEFKVPTEEELESMRQIHRDRTPDSKDRIEKAKKYKEFLNNLPEDERKLLEEEGLW